MIEIINLCKEANILGWKLKDESRKVYTFQNITLGRISLHSGSEAHSGSLFWTSQEVWNNDRDTIYIFDKDGKLVYHESYGY